MKLSKIKDYEIVSGTANHIHEEINNRIQLGWETCGELTWCADDSFAQAMVRFKEK